MNALCPNCGESEGERTGRSHDRGSGIEVSFTCPECDHDWSVGL
ncbi:hypothetical protein [Halosimplex halophilum]|nr:hypothetical protein [Halosimplex halophilum]